MVLHGKILLVLTPHDFVVTGRFGGVRRGLFSARQSHCQPPLLNQIPPANCGRPLPVSVIMWDCGITPERHHMGGNGSRYHVAGYRMGNLATSANIKPSSNVGLLLAHRLQRRPISKRTVVRGISPTRQYLNPMLIYCWPIAYNDGPTLFQHFIMEISLVSEDQWSRCGSA